MTSLIYVALTMHTDNSNTEEENNTDCPLRLWNKALEKLTSVKKDSDVKPAYRALLDSVDKNCYN